MSTLLWRPALLVGALVLGLTACGSGTASLRPASALPTETARPARIAFTPTDYDGWLNRLPSGLPLAAGMPRPGGDFQRSHARVSLLACGHEVFTRRSEAVDSRAVTTTGPEFGDQHALLLFADDRAASDYLDRALVRAQTCPSETHSTTTWSLSVRPTRGGFRAVRTYTDSGMVVPGADWWEGNRVGNVVLLTSRGGEYLPDAVRQGIRVHHAELRPLVRSLCAFTPGGCPTRDPDLATELPLTAGYPADKDSEGPGYGLEGPTRALPLGDFELCDAHSTLPRPTDELGASWTNVEDFRHRHLLTFPDALAASEWIGQLRAFWTACPQERTGAGFVGLQTLRRTAVGGESWALVRHFRYHGKPGVGLDVIQVVRLGRAVLVDQVSNEGGAGPELEAEISGVLEGMTKASARVVAAMCVYTEAGCPAPAGTLTLGPDGLGPLSLGMSADEARAAGARVVPSHNGTGCSEVSLVADGHRITSDLDPMLGISMLTSTGVVTPQGAGDGQPAWRAYAAYPRAQRDLPLLLASPPGRTDRTYRMELFHGRVSSLRLLDPKQHCAS